MVTLEDFIPLSHLVQHRAVSFNWVSKVSIAVVLHCYAVWLTKKSRATFSTNPKWNQNQSWLAFTHFPAFGAGYMYLLRVLIGSLDWLRLLWLVTESNYFGVGLTTPNWTEYHKKVLLNSFHLNYHTLGFHPQNQKHTTTSVYSIMNSTTGKYCSVAFIWMVTL